MNMHAPAKVGEVTVAKAAQLLTASGDKITPSNVSRYLDRIKTIPTRKQGKFRYVDFESLRDHRLENAAVVEKQAARSADTPPPSVTPQPRTSPPPADPAPEEPEAPPGSELAGIQLELKRIQLRDAQLDILEREKSIIPSDQVFTLISTVLDKFISHLQRQEAEIIQSFGREVGADFRKRRKGAQAAAAAELAKLAKEILSASDAAAMVEATPQTE